LFVDFGAFLDSPAERKRLLDGLIEIADESVLASARAGAQDGARKVLSPEAQAWIPDCTARLKGELFDALRMALDAPTPEGLALVLSDLSARHKAAKAMTEEAAKAPLMANTRDPNIIVTEISEVRTSIATCEAQDRDAAATQARRVALETRLGKLRAVPANRRAELMAQLAELDAVELAPKTSPRLALDMEQVEAQRTTARAAWTAAAGGKCPTCGHPVPANQTAMDEARAKGLALKAQAEELTKAVAEAKALELANSTRWQEARTMAAGLRGDLAELPTADANEVDAIVAELANLPVRFRSGEELDAARLRLRNLEQEAEIARSANAAVALSTSLNVPALELAGKAIRAAQKGWDQGKAEAFAAVVGPIEASMTESIGAPVTIDPANNWEITIRDRPAESRSGGERLAIWGAFVAALAKPGDVLLCEAAEADPEYLSAMLSALEESPAALIVVATHLPIVGTGLWTVINPGEVADAVQ
jgi:hypothetical protein